MDKYLLWNSDESTVIISNKGKVPKTVFTHKGKIEIENPLTYGKTLYSSTGKKYYVLKPTHKDINDKILRTTNTFIIKDLSVIIGYTSLNKDSMVLEIGAGSGGLSIFLSNFVKKIISIDINFFNILTLKKNIEKYSYQDNIYPIISNEKNFIFKEDLFDLVVIDLPEPGIYADICKICLKDGGDLVFAVPNIEQVKETRELLSKRNFVRFITIEVWIRQWLIRTNYCRPYHEIQSHSMFLTFCKKIS